MKPYQYDLPFSMFTMERKDDQINLKNKYDHDGMEKHFYIPVKVFEDMIKHYETHKDVFKKVIYKLIIIKHIHRGFGFSSKDISLKQEMLMPFPPSKDIYFCDELFSKIYFKEIVNDICVFKCYLPSDKTLYNTAFQRIQVPDYKINTTIKEIIDGYLNDEKWEFLDERCRRNYEKLETS